jgi:hypothetical protein
MTRERYFWSLWHRLTPDQRLQLERSLTPEQRALIVELREYVRWSNAS